MQIEIIDNRNICELYQYWISIGEEVPYYFPVEYQSFKNCLFNDRRYDDNIFRYTEEYVAREQGKILGFIQYGQPHFHLTSKGDKCNNPQIGVIRNLYYKKDRQDVGKVLIQKAEEYFKKSELTKCYAFYHAMGMGCNAGHGKLFESMIHIEKLLKKHKFQIEHENVYYRKELGYYKKTNSNTNIKLLPHKDKQESKQIFKVVLDEKEVGKVDITYLVKAETVYLNWIAIQEQYRNKGIGTTVIRTLLDYLSNQRIKQLDTDTARDNIAAQNFYEKNGFDNLGFSRSYIRLDN